jgi:hypothetical protein
LSALRLLPWPAHQAILYLAGIFLVLAPFVFGLLDTSALSVLLGAGVVLLATAVLSRGPLGIVDVLPFRAQAAVEYVLAFFLMVAPFLFGFRRQTAGLLTAVLVGLGLLIVFLVTTPPVPPDAARQTRRQTHRQRSAHSALVISARETSPERTRATGFPRPISGVNSDVPRPDEHDHPAPGKEADDGS